MRVVVDQGAVEQFAAAGLDPPFHDRVRAGHPYAAEDALDAGVGEDGVEQYWVLAVAVADEEPARQPASCRSMARLGHGTK
jgi:hypothetical protein